MLFFIQMLEHLRWLISAVEFKFSDLQNQIASTLALSKPIKLKVLKTYVYNTVL